MHRYDSMDKAVLSPVWRSVVPYTIFFLMAILLSFFSTFLILWWIGVLGLWTWIWFLGSGFSVDGVWSMWCRDIRVF